MKKGIELIADERARQISSEGWTAAHDAEHSRGEINQAAQCYCAAAELQINGVGDCVGDTPGGWPWDYEWWKPSDDPVRNLVKAGALIAAEIDRIQNKQRMEDAVVMKPHARGLADS